MSIIYLWAHDVVMLSGMLVINLPIGIPSLFPFLYYYNIPLCAGVFIEALSISDKIDLIVYDNSQIITKEGLAVQMFFKRVDIDK